MTELEKAARMALEQLEFLNDCYPHKTAADAITALTQALATTERKGGPVTIEAVATVGDCAELRWLVEGGVTALPPGAVLLVADKVITEGDGQGEVCASPHVPEGFALVPVEPTPEMIRCAEMWDDGFEGAYARALDAARKEQA